MAARLFMGRIEIDDGFRDLGFGAGSNIARDEASAKVAQQPVLDRLTLRKHPDPKRRIEIVHAFQNPLVEARNV